jgi:hypothetical protein
METGEQFFLGVVMVVCVYGTVIIGMVVGTLDRRTRSPRISIGTSTGA